MSIRSFLISHPKIVLISSNEQLFNAKDLSSTIFGIILSPNPHGKNLTKSKINSGTTYGNKNSKVRTIKILLDSSASFVCKDVLYKHHKILKDKKNKCYTMAGIFNTTFQAKLKLKLPELNYTAKINAKCHLTG